jgi:hypothetical protein
MQREVDDMRKVTSVLLVIGLITALLGVGVLSGCAGEEKAPTLTGVSPSSGKAGETISVTITGTDLTDASAVSFGSGITVDSYTVDSETQITASITVSSGATLGSRTASVTTPDGTATKANAFTVESPLAPSVTGVSPNSGEQNETLDVTITGEGFAGATAVSFGNGVTVNSYAVNSDTQISADIAIAPDAVVDMRDVSVTNPGGTGRGTDTFEVTWPAALDALIEAAVAEEELTLRGAWHSTDVEQLQAGFNEYYGTDVTFNYSPEFSMPSLANQLLTEFEAGEKASTDVYYGSVTNNPQLHLAGAAMTYDWKELFPFIPDENIELDGTALAFVTYWPGITYNTNLIPEEEVPRNLRDVLGKGWALASTTYGAGFDRLTDERLGLGVEGTIAFTQDLAAELDGLIGCSDSERIASEEFTLLILDCGDGEALQASSQGAPVKQTPLEDAATMTFNYLSIPKNAQHLNLAALFVGYSQTLEFQQILQQYHFKSNHRIEGSTKWQEYNDFVAQGMEFVVQSATWYEEHMDELRAVKGELLAILRGG